MTEKAYFAEPLVLEFEAQIIETRPQADGTAQVILDRTYFYPTGGGQSNDTGRINGQAVLDVRSENGDVLHVVQGTLAAGRAHCQIDRAVRIGNMQAHTGQHILSAAFVHALEAETLAVKMSAVTVSTVDVARGNLTAEQIARVELMANQVIMENREIRSYFVPADDPRLEELRRAVKFEKVSGDVRLVDIDNWDLSACAGTHFPSTGMLGLLKIVKTENYKGGSRVYFVAGYQALEQFRRYQTALDQSAALLSSAVDDVPGLLAKLQAERQELARQVSAQRDALLGFEREQWLAQAQEINGRRLVTAAFDGRSPDDVRILGNQLAEQAGVIAVLANRQSEQIGVAISAAPDAGVHAGNLLKSVLDAFGGRGGGRDQYAQGTCQAADPAAVLAAAQTIITAILQN